MLWGKMLPDFLPYHSGEADSECAELLGPVFLAEVRSLNLRNISELLRTGVRAFVPGAAQILLTSRTPFLHVLCWTRWEARAQREIREKGICKDPQTSISNLPI